MTRFRTLAAELVVPFLLLGYATHYYLEVRALPRPETNLLLIEPVYLVLLACCVLFAVLRIRQAFHPQTTEKAEPSPDGERLGAWKSIAFLVMTLAYVLLMPLVGFVTTSIVYIVSLAMVLGVRSPVVLAATPGLVIGLLYVGMEWWLNLPLPAGILL